MTVKTWQNSTRFDTKCNLRFLRLIPTIGMYLNECSVRVYKKLSSR